MAHSARSFLFGPTALVVLLLLLCASWPTNVAGKKSRRKRKAAKKEEEKSFDDLLEIQKRMGPSEFWEEIEADNFKKKVFRKDKDVLVFIYGDQVPACLMARGPVEQLGELIKNTNPNVRTMRFDDMRFGKDLASSSKEIREDFALGMKLPRMYLVRAYEKKPIAVPDKDLWRGETLARFIVDHSSFRKEFGFDDFVANKPDETEEEKKANDVSKSGSVGRSKHYKELLPSEFRNEVRPGEKDTFLVYYSDRSKNCQKFWKQFEKAASTVKANVKDLSFFRLDVHRHNVWEKDKKGQFYMDPQLNQLSIKLDLPYGVFLPKDTSKEPDILMSGQLEWYGKGAIIEFLINNTRKDTAHAEL